MKVIVSGSHGFIGTALVPALERAGHTAIRLVRSAPKAGEAQWDPEAGTIDGAALEGADTVVHLAGVSLADHRWTLAQKQAILDSRVKGTTLLAETLAQLDQKPKVWASGSAIGFYGDRGDEELTEGSSAGSGFLASVCQQWEAATLPAEEAGVRVVHVRTGIVLGRGGGALGRLLLPFKLGLGGRIGSGRQWMSWISRPDHAGAILEVITNDAYAGPVNFTAPAPVTNEMFAKMLGRVLKRPTFIPLPAIAMRAVLGAELADEVLLGGQRVIPTELQSRGFQFRHVLLEDALRDILKK